MQVYILHSKSFNRFYVGLSKDVTVRLLQHNRGENRSTKAYRPWVLVNTEEYPNKKLALKREKFLKSEHGRIVLKNLYSVKE